MSRYFHKRLGYILCAVVLVSVTSWFFPLTKTIIDQTQKRAYMQPKNKTDTSIATTLHNNEAPEGMCSPKKNNIFFLKVHKAASSTTQNIFLRYASRNRLNVALPNKLIGSFHIIGSKVYRERLIPIPANETYNILCNHLTYNTSMIHNIMPPDTFYVGIVRDPVKHFSSGLQYFGFMKRIQEKLYSMDLNLTHEEAILYYGRNRETFKGLALYINNLMSHDFGLNREDFDDDSMIETFIAQIDGEFDFVMLAEYYDESIVLLKRYLCWELKDILYMNKLVASDKKREEMQFLNNPTVLSWLETWNKADFALYKHFQKKFWSHVYEQENSFFLEVQYFVSVRERVVNFCKNGPLTDQNITLKETEWNKEFFVDRLDCEIMSKPEKMFVKTLMVEAASRVNYILPTESSSLPH